MARPSNYRAGYRKNTRNGQKKENKFYTKVNNGGILNKRLPDIDEIKQNIEAERARAQEYENEWLDSVVNNADKRQTEATKARAQEAKNSVKSWNEKLSEAYGLGEDGYWNRGTQKSITQQSEKMRANPEHAYGIGQYRPAAEQQKPEAISSSAGSAKSRQIMQLQDTLVHNPGMSDAEKSTLQEKINNLTAEKEVLDWKDANPGTPTVESYEAQKGYYDRLWQQNQDAIVNGLGNGTIKQESDEWYELFKKGDDLLAIKDAYNRGMMGQLDGEKAQTESEQAATVTAGGSRRSAGFDANDEAMFTGGTAPGIDDGEEENQTVGDSNDTTEPDTSDFDTLKDLMERATANVQGEYVYITEEQYEAIKDIIEQSLEERLATDSPTPSDIDEAQQMYALEQNREWSKNSDLCDAIIVNVDEPYGNVDIDRMEELSNDDEPRTPEEELLAKINLGIGVRIDINGSDFAALKEQLGAYGAAQFLAEYVQDNYGEDVLDDRSVNGFIAEVYIHDYINTMIPDDFDYSEIEDRQLAEALLGWKDTG